MAFTFGGKGGAQFSDEVTGEHVTAVRVRHGRMVDAVAFRFGSRWGRQHGGSGGREDVFQVKDGDYICNVQARAGTEVDAIRFLCASGDRSPWYGGNGGTLVESKNPTTQALRVVYGRAGDRVDALCLRFGAAPRGATPVGPTILVGDGYGGNGGSPFYDRKTGRVRAVRLRSGSRLDSIQLLYDQAAGEPHGGSGGTEHTFTVEENDAITAVDVWTGSTVDAIQFYTRKGVSSKKFGGGGGGRRRIEGKNAAWEVVGITGRSGRLVDRLDFIFQEAGSGEFRVTDVEFDLDSIFDHSTRDAEIDALRFTHHNHLNVEGKISIDRTVEAASKNVWSIDEIEGSHHDFNASATFKYSWGGVAGIGFQSSAEFSVGYSAGWNQTRSTTNGGENDKRRSFNVKCEQTVPPRTSVLLTFVQKVQAGKVPFKAKIQKFVGDVAAGPLETTHGVVECRDVVNVEVYARRI